MRGRKGIDQLTCIGVSSAEGTVTVVVIQDCLFFFYGMQKLFLNQEICNRLTEIRKWR